MGLDPFFNKLYQVARKCLCALRVLTVSVYATCGEKNLSVLAVSVYATLCASVVNKKCTTPASPTTRIPMPPFEKSLCAGGQCLRDPLSLCGE